MFEELRMSMATVGDPKFYKSTKAIALRNEFIEAGTAVEEINRIHGLILLIKQYGDQCQKLAKDVYDSIQRSPSPIEGEICAVFPPQPG